jgi:hypothetical protein
MQVRVTAAPGRYAFLSISGFETERDGIAKAA